ncbi:right-handed parallel beta-helix repeat-containing protein [Streptantibioticus ferralitis]|uniref:Right-handed parallel beta-helix repeat-containing protein n=1 Tax=Streptantibioticus ferralitis TaxID=236510 RepID=A0ABT5YTY0_9ACTN|nr:right-handed parallel beta-helix repeat-containing protein [Streptantibioticus ferralitis]MDF2254913.1 right-handed parallel beta-helix repeat-containing protein [Streptantibioticus ferralitis]
MRKRRAQYLVPLATVLVSGWTAAPPAAAANRHIVHPGESIQQAVEHASPGETLYLLPGTYRESIEVTVPGLTLRGVGPETVLTPGTTRPENACAKAGHGICVTGTGNKPLAGVRIQSLTVSGFTKDGISASWTDQMSVRDVRVENNGQQGISQQLSTRGEFRHNVIRNNGESGILLANVIGREGGAIDTQGAVIGGNYLQGNHYGVVIRRARNLVIKHNTITGNCGGVFVVGDENVPRAGAITIRRNRVEENNKLCPKSAHLPKFQGVGILVTGAEQTLVTHNLVRGNSGRSPMSGGIVLYRSHFGAPNSHITIRDNTVRDNNPADLANRDVGEDNTFARNSCRVSEPTGSC